jgi:GTP-binding protein
VNPFAQAAFVLSVAETAQLPPAHGYEVAFAGRSNVGKSSAINALTHRHRLAFVARRPGKTRMIQFYQLGADRYLVDLPGYGYARVSATLRVQWERLLESYLAHRRSLVGLVLIMDIRHPLTPLDQRLLNWFVPRGLPVHILLNKADKLSYAMAIAAQRELEHGLQQRGFVCSFQRFSSLRREGVDEASEVVGRWLGLNG